jgi:hypothetical protein
MSWSRFIFIAAGTEQVQLNFLLLKRRKDSRHFTAGQQHFPTSHIDLGYDPTFQTGFAADTRVAANEREI